MPRRISSATSLELLRKQAKRWLKALRTGDQPARERLVQAYPASPSEPALRDVQHALAREYGFHDWPALTQAVESARPSFIDRIVSVEEYERLVEDLIAAFNARDAEALQRLNASYQRTFTLDDLGAEIWRRVYSFRQRTNRTGEAHIELGEAQTMVAQDAGYGSYRALMDGIATGAPRVPAFEFDASANAVAPRRQLGATDWDALFSAIREHGATAFHAHGLMTDGMMPRLAQIEHITRLTLGGSRQLTDEGVRHLARMPQLEHLELSGASVSDRGLEVLRHLPNLRTLQLGWHRSVTDAGLAHLRSCERLEVVDLMGSPVGDGAIDALQGKAHLRELKTGRLVTDAGLAMLGTLPALETLLLDGPFTDDGLARLRGLTRLADLDLFWHAKNVTSAAFAHLVDLPNLRSIGADGELSDNRAMQYYGRMPGLQRLRAQGTVASDEGFESLSASRTLESLWTRETPHLGNRGFVALSRMPALRSLGVSCRQVDDLALASLPSFPALRELTPIDVTDRGFRHIGRCETLERLSCMYCRDTTDVATGYIAGLGIRHYYAGLTQITDASLQVLGRMRSLEQAEFFECRGITDAGLPALAQSATLREVHLGSCPGITLQGTRVFPARILVRYST